MDNVNTILNAASAILEEKGPEALTARAVCEAVGIKAPTLYHYFGGKDGLEKSLIERGMAEFMHLKQTTASSDDPFKQLKSGWDLAVEFALERPSLYKLYAQYSLTHPEIFADGYALMLSRIQRLVDLGIFNGPLEESARAFWAASQGALSLISQGHDPGDVKITSELLFGAITTQLKR